MRIASYLADGAARVGIVEDERVIDLAIPELECCSLKSIIRNGQLRTLRSSQVKGGISRRIADISFLPLIPRPGKIIAVGINYHEHRMETGRQAANYPMIFARFADSQVGHLQPMRRPAISEEFDYEGELAVIIGTEGHNISLSTALSHVAGYSIYNDGSVRDWQYHTSQFGPGKNFPATGAFGPWMVTADEVPNPQQLKLQTRLNGVVVQSATTDLMIFPVVELISYISRFTYLYPGDVIITGTPGGVGAKRKPPLFMKAGDVVEVEISGLGILRNPICDESM